MDSVTRSIAEDAGFAACKFYRRNSGFKAQALHGPLVCNHLAELHISFMNLRPRPLTTVDFFLRGIHWFKIVDSNQRGGD